MRFYLYKICIFLILGMTVNNVFAQKDTIPPTTPPANIDLNEWLQSATPKEYTIANVAIVGDIHLDSTIVSSVSGIQKGQKFVFPGSDIFSKAIINLWKQKLFADVQIFITQIVDDKISVQIQVTERPRLGNFKFEGIKKSDAEDLSKKVGLVKQSILSESIRQNIHEVVKTFYEEKGFYDIKTELIETPDPLSV